MEPWIWLGLMLAFLVLEGLTVMLVSAWFAAGSLAALIASVCGAPLWLQIVLFGVISLALLACLRPLVRKFYNPRLMKTNVDSLVGTQGLVLEAIDNLQPAGRVKLGGMEWSARSENGQKIPAGTVITVGRIEGVKVFVSPAEAE